MVKLWSMVCTHRNENTWTSCKLHQAAYLLKPVTVVYIEYIEECCIEYKVPLWPLPATYTQVALLSPLLFNIYSEHIKREIFDRQNGESVVESKPFTLCWCSSQVSVDCCAEITGMCPMSQTCPRDQQLKNRNYVYRTSKNNHIGEWLDMMMLQDSNIWDQSLNKQETANQ